MLLIRWWWSWCTRCLCRAVEYCGHGRITTIQEIRYNLNFVSQPVLRLLSAFQFVIEFLWETFCFKLSNAVWQFWIIWNLIWIRHICFSHATALLHIAFVCRRDARDTLILPYSRHTYRCATDDNWSQDR